jgi:hypothetical protein
MAHNQIYQWYFERFPLSMLRVLETQVHKTQVEVSKSSLGFDNSFVVNSQRSQTSDFRRLGMRSMPGNTPNWEASI